MNATGLLVLSALASLAAVTLVVSGWRQPRPSLDRALAHLNRRPVAPPDPAHRAGVDPMLERVGRRSPVRTLLDHRRTATRLRLLERTPADHAGRLSIAAAVGFVAPSAVLAVLATLGGSSPGLLVPAAVSVVTAVTAPVLLHLSAMSQAEEVRVDLRHQLSGYLDMVTMLLAGNTGHETALEQAAASGHGLLFRELRRRMREVATTGSSMVVALSIVADDLDMVELDQIAATTALSAAEGAPVARTLAAKCATLRSTIAADAEARARILNDKITPPLVGMAVLFMVLIIYPALNPV